MLNCFIKNFDLQFAGTPGWLKAGAKTEMFIKTGLVLLGAEVLFGKIVTLGPPGLMVAWLGEALE